MTNSPITNRRPPNRDHQRLRGDNLQSQRGSGRHPQQNNCQPGAPLAQALRAARLLQGRTSFRNAWFASTAGRNASSSWGGGQIEVVSVTSDCP